jgi:hypothetical protein
VSGGLIRNNQSAFRNVVDNLWDSTVNRAPTVGHAGLNRQAGKFRGDLDFHIGSAPKTDWRLAENINDQLTQAVLDVSRDHGVMGTTMTREVMGMSAKNAANFNNYLLAVRLDMKIAKHYSGYIENGLVRADQYLARGVYFSSRDLAFARQIGVNKAPSAAGNYALIFKHGNEPIFRKLADVYSYRGPSMYRLDLGDLADNVAQSIESGAEAVWEDINPWAPFYHDTPDRMQAGGN